MRLLVALVLVLMLLPVADAARPFPMALEGTLRVNGAPAAEGTPVAVTLLDGTTLVESAVRVDGRYRVDVPGDDPATSAREGAREGEGLALRALGGSALVGAFATATARQADANLTLPDLALLAAEPTSATVDEGDDVALHVAVENRGTVGATGVRVYVFSGDATLAATVLDPIAAGETRETTLVVSTAGLADAPPLRAVVGGGNGDADPRNDVRAVVLALRSDPAPQLALAATPAAPSDEDEIRLVAEASDDDGIASVTFYWQSDEVRSANVSVAPYSIAIGRLEAGTTLRYWAVAVDAGPSAKRTTAETRTLVIHDADASIAPTTAPSAANETPGPATSTTAGSPTSSPSATPSAPSARRGIPETSGALLSGLAVAALLGARKRE